MVHIDGAQRMFQKTQYCIVVAVPYKLMTVPYCVGLKGA